MKTTFLFVAILIAISFTACNDNSFETAPDYAELKSASIDSTCTDSIFTSDIDNLTEADIAGLLLMREEEKLAHDVYTYFFDLYNQQIFEQIAKSESKHAASVLRLLNHFGIEDPTIDEVGIFANEELQGLYDELIALGDVSIEAALSAGALIEETDIIDLQNLIENTGNSDIITVYSKLLKGSETHLKAFVRVLLTYNISYETQLLTQEAYETILASSDENSNQNQNGKNNQNSNNQYNEENCDGTSQQNKNINNESNSGGQNGNNSLSSDNQNNNENGDSTSQQNKNKNNGSNSGGQNGNNGLGSDNENGK